MALTVDRAVVPVLDRSELIALAQGSAVPLHRLQGALESMQRMCGGDLRPDDARKILQHLVDAYPISGDIGVSLLAQLVTYLKSKSGKR